MFNKFIENRHIKKTIKKDVYLLCAEIEAIRKVSETLAICPQPTLYSWMGVNTATKGLFPNNTFEIPQYYSNPVYTEKELFSIAIKINECKFSNVIFSGFVPYFTCIIKNLKKIKIGTIYHGSLSGLSGNTEQARILSLIINLYTERKINKIACHKKGLAETLKKLFNVSSFEILLKTSIPEIQKNKFSFYDSKVHVGILANNQFLKNIHTQVAGALMIDNSVVHVSDNAELFYLGHKDRIINHGASLNHEEYLKLLAANDINMYVSFSESWGMVITESLLLGVPCLASYNSGIFDYDDYLKEMLIVKDYDNSEAIFKQAELVLANRQKISEQGIEYVKELNKIAKEKLRNFLDL